MRKGESKLARDLYNKSDKNQKSGREQIRLIRERKKENLNEKKKKIYVFNAFCTVIVRNLSLRKVGWEFPPDNPGK